MNESARYAKVVAWSEEDQLYIGRAPGLMDGGCHGTDEKAVFDEICEIVEEVIELYHIDGKSLPPATIAPDFIRQLEELAQELPKAS